MLDPTISARTVKISRRPLYTQAIEALHELLEQGQYKPGDPLPSEDVLARQLGISRSTLREALGYLETHGLVSRRQGIGTFVGAPVKTGFMGGLERLESFHSLAMMAGMDVNIAERTVTLTVATPDIASPLSLPPGAELVRVQAVEAVNDRRSAYLDTYVKCDYAGLDDLTDYDGTVIDFLTGRRGAALSHTRSEILAVHADERIAEKLKVPLGQAVLHLAEEFYASDGQAMALSLNYFLTDHFRFYLIRRVPQRRHDGASEPKLNGNQPRP